MKFFDPEKVKQMPFEKRNKLLRVLGSVILLDVALAVGLVVLILAQHKPLNTPSNVFAFTVSGIGLLITITFWVMSWSAFKRIPYSEKQVSI